MQIVLASRASPLSNGSEVWQRERVESTKVRRQVRFIESKLTAGLNNQDNLVNVVVELHVISASESLCCGCKRKSGGYARSGGDEAKGTERLRVSARPWV